MSFLKKIDKHAHLVTGMSETVGVDWVKTLAQHPEMTEQFRSAVFKCTRCKEVHACEHWLKVHHQAELAPSYCKNKDLFAGMKDL